MKRHMPFMLLCIAISLSLSACALNPVKESESVAVESDTSSAHSSSSESSFTEVVSKENYQNTCAQYTYEQLTANSEGLSEKPITVKLDITKSAEKQYLGVDAGGNIYLLFDERVTDTSSILENDSITIYGDYDGLIDISGKQIPSIVLRYMDKNTSSSLVAAESAEELPPTPTEIATPIPTETPLPEYETMYVVNCNESITLRTSPSTSAAEIRQIPLGAAVSYIENAGNGFYKVIYLGDTGYALASYLSRNPQASYTPPQNSSSSGTQNYQTLYVVNCRESITLRTSPSTSASEIRQIPLGAAVSYVGSASNGFYKVIYLGDTGYALASYLSSTNSGGSSSGGYDWNQTLYVVNCRESITLRTSPSTSASEIRQIPLGEPVTFQEYASNGFLKISYMGDTGYALSSYLSD